MADVADNPPSVSGWIDVDDPDAEDLLIVLEGELDYSPGTPGRQVGEQLRERAELIGALVSHDPTRGVIEANPWNGPVVYRCQYNPDQDGACIETIETVAKISGEHVATHDVANLFADRGLDLDAIRAGAVIEEAEAEEATD